jgi:phosphoglycolate phosphatase-like HAD superfamily hydrolase
MVGDSAFDCESACRAGVPTIGVLTGGFSEMELREAGAIEVFESLQELMGALTTCRWRAAVEGRVRRAR